MAATASAFALSSFWGSAAGRPAHVRLGSELAAADPSTPAARERLRAALEGCVAERKGARSAAKCAGLIAEPCLKLSEGSAPLAAADCYRWEAAGWMNLLEDYRGRLSRRFEADRRKRARLQEAEAGWASDRTPRCDKAASRIGQPSEPAASACELKESSRRAVYLRLLARDAGAL